MNSKYCGRFEEFGDLATKKEWKPATMLIGRLREDLKSLDLPLTLVSDECLDYGTAVPLCYLTANLPKVKIIPLRPSSHLDIETHFKIGRALQTEIATSTSRIAVLASADLSHRVGENSPEGLSPKGIAFDEKVQEILREKNQVGFLDIDPDWIKEAGSCSTMVLALLFGLLDGIHHKSEILSYEKPFGVGYLVAAMHLI
jgi:aromatic ring-opening dioxygenase LigB subunit